MGHSSAKSNLPPDYLSEIAVTAWKISCRAERDPIVPRSIAFAAEKILELLSGGGVVVISHQGRRVDAGIRVRILDIVPGIEGTVIEEHEPEIQIDGKIIRQALVTVGSGRTKSEEPLPMPEPELPTP